MWNLVNRYLSGLLMLLFWGIVASHGLAQPFGRFVGFDGVDDELSVDNDPIPSFSDFTLEFWFRSCDPYISPGQAIIGNSNRLEINAFSTSFLPDSTTFYQLCLKYDQGYVCNQDHRFTPKDTSWHHLAVIYDYWMDDFEYYFDGVDGTIAHQEFNFMPWHTLKIGVGSFPISSSQHFNGFVDEMRISNTKRYTASFTPPTSPFTLDSETRALWHFDEANSANIFADESSNGFKALSSGNPKTYNYTVPVSYANRTFTSLETFSSYQWIDCSTMEPIPGETGPVFYPQTYGKYALRAGDGACPFLSECMNMVDTLENGDTTSQVGFEELSSEILLNVYPNPTNDFIRIRSSKPLQESELLLYNQLGQLIRQQKIETPTTDISWDVSSLPEGIYYLKLSRGEHFSKPVKLVVWR